MATPDRMLHLHVSVRRRAGDRVIRATLRVLGLARIIWRRRLFPADMPISQVRGEMIRYALSRFGGRCGIQWRQALPMADPDDRDGEDKETAGPG